MSRIDNWLEWTGCVKAASLGRSLTQRTLTNSVARDFVGKKKVQPSGNIATTAFIK